MIDVNVVLPTVKQYFPEVPDDQLIADIQQFAQLHPELSNEEGLQALEVAMSEESNLEAGEQPPMPQPEV